jgi:hypothetical protein
MSALPIFVSLDLVAELIPLSRKTLRNMKALRAIEWLHHVDECGRYSRKLLVHLQGAIDYWIERGKPQVAKWLIERARPRTTTVRDLLLQLLEEEEARA